MKSSVSLFVPRSRAALLSLARVSATASTVIAVTAATVPVIGLAQSAGDTAPSSVVVTATRNPQAPQDVLSDNVVISSQEIEQSGAANLLDLLQQKRAIEIVVNGGPGGASSVLLRGTNSEQTLVLVDGVRIGSSTLGGATWENIPLSQIDHIEVVYGPLSSLYGADAMGGVVQVFTKQGEGAPHASVAVGYGSYDTRTLDASVTGASGVGSSGGDPKIHYALNADRDESSGFPATTPDAGPYTYKPNRDGYDKASVSGQISVDETQGHTLGVSFLQSQNSAQFDEGLGDNNQNYDDHEIERLNTYKLFSRDQVTAGWTSLLQLSLSEDKFWSTNGPYWQAYGLMPNNTFDTTQTDLSWQNDIKLGTDLLQLIAERREEHVDTNDGVAGERNTNSLAASYQWKSGNQLGVVSLRDDDSDQFGSQTTGSLAYGYRFSPVWRVNASVGTSFRAPTFNELYYPGYGIATNKPEQGRNVETGLYYDDGKSQWNAVLYRNRITDLLIYDPVCPVGGYPYGCAYNVDHALLTGLSLGGRTALGDFSVHGSIDFQDPVDQTTDTLLVRRARQHGSVGVDYRSGFLVVGVDSVFSGKRNDEDANGDAQVLGGYGLLNLHANMDIGGDWSLFGRWNNLLNKDYALAYGYTTPGSNLLVGLRYGFK